MRLLRELEAEAADYDTSLLRSRMRIIGSVSFVSVSVSECVRPIQFQIFRLVGTFSIIVISSQTFV